MRYRNIESIEFINSLGEKKTIRGVRQPEIASNGLQYSKIKGREFDDVAASLWGPNFEIASYRLREQNIEKLLCEDFNENELINIVVPPLGV